jgi:Ni,Fe-hydrogenase III small subunit/NAD-dependent dihydropyrimidine dehydrogenase PreA subunit
MLETYHILKHQGKQYIPDITKPVLPELFRGRPVIDAKPCGEGCTECRDICPTQAIQLDPVRLDLGTCVFCKECQWVCSEEKIKFTNDYKIATNLRHRLIVAEGHTEGITLDPDQVRQEIVKNFGSSLKLRQVSAGGDNSTEMELNACSNVNFDMGRWGIDWVASPRHADGVVISGPISENMSEALQICYDAIPDPKMVILAGTDAISGGIFAGSPAIRRDFLEKYKVDLFVPGNPPHPLTFINGVLEMMRGGRV